MSLLQFASKNRLSAREALRHPYFEELAELHSHSDSSSISKKAKIK
jgi:hypothetical protein